MSSPAPLTPDSNTEQESQDVHSSPGLGQIFAESQIGRTQSQPRSHLFKKDRPNEPRKRATSLRWHPHSHVPRFRRQNSKLISRDLGEQIPLIGGQGTNDKGPEKSSNSETPALTSEPMSEGPANVEGKSDLTLNPDSESVFPPIDDVSPFAGPLKLASGQTSTLTSNEAPNHRKAPNGLGEMSTAQQFTPKASGSLQKQSLASSPPDARDQKLVHHAEISKGYTKQDYLNEASRLQQSPSPYQSSATQSTNDFVDAERLAQLPSVSQKNSYQSPDTVAVREQATNSRKHWLRELLAKYSALTAATPDAKDHTHIHGRYTSRLMRRPRSFTIPAREESHRSGSHEIQPNDLERDEEQGVEALARDTENRSAEEYRRTIRNLEVLLAEALQVAERDPLKDDHPPRSRRVNISNSTDGSGDYTSSSEDQLRDTAPRDARVVIVEPETLPKHHGLSSKDRKVTPYPNPSGFQTRDSPLLPFADTSGRGNALPLPLVDDFDARRPQSESSDESSEGYEPLAIPLKRLRSQAPSTEHQNVLAPEHLSATESPLNGNSPNPATGRLDVEDQGRQRTMPYDESTPHARLDDLRYFQGDSSADFPPLDFDDDRIRKFARTSRGAGSGRTPSPPLNDIPVTSISPRPVESDVEDISHQPGQNFNLEGHHHRSIREPLSFSFSRSHRRAPIARDWSNKRKRFVATITCLNTALIGLMVGIYAGEVPAIQYSIADEHHYAILGNVVFFLGLAVSTLLFWPLPLLHGRKPYTLGALAIFLPLQFPQALAVESARSPYIATYRVGLLFPRALSGIVIGFAQINFIATLLDLFGASLQSRSPHQEFVNENDVRRHGGGMGIWLGIWTWSSIGSLSAGFLIGAAIISGLTVPWGFWITIILTTFVLLLNVFVPEVRRSPYRRSLAEVKEGDDVSRRIARGEIKMHLDSTGPIWWWEEVTAGLRLSARMLAQPGFAVLALYVGWIYGQVVLLIVVSSQKRDSFTGTNLLKLLGALLSRYYLFHSEYVGLCVFAIAIGALLAVPFQKASLFSRSRRHAPRTDSMTFEKRVTWSSHLLRRAIFMILLPLAVMGYTLASGGTHINFMGPTILAGLVGFLSNLAIAECNGLIMETYDTSDLQPGMTGRPRRESFMPEEIRKRRTNYSCYPRISAAFAVTQCLSFLIAAGCTGWGGVVERRLGAQVATAVWAGVLLLISLLLFAALTRFAVVQVVPTQRYGTGLLSAEDNEWKPVIIGNPSGTTRRISLLELGQQSRWTEIRRRNKLMSGRPEDA